MRPMIFEMWVLTYTNDRLRTVLFTEQVYLEKLPAQKAAWYQNGSYSRRPPNSPKIEVLTMEQYVRAREREAEHLGELRGQFPEHY